MRPVRAGLLALGLLVTACGGTGRGHATGSTAGTRPSSPRPTAAPPPTLRVEPASFTLPRGSARAALVPDGDHLLLAGGLDGARRTTGEVLRIDPAAGAVRPAGTLAVAVHDTAGALMGDSPMIFGGGNTTESAAVQQLSGPAPTVVGQLPVPRSDLAAASVGDRTYLVGGYDGSRVRPTTIVTTNGVHFTPLGDLVTPVRYPAVAALAGRVYVLGGTTTGNAAGAVRTVQALDPASGVVTAVGDLPVRVTDAVAVTLAGHLYLVGGIVDGQIADTIWRVDLPTAPGGPVALAPVGRLPTPTADAAVATLHGRAYLVGGESPDLLSSVTTLEVR